MPELAYFVELFGWPALFQFAVFLYFFIFFQYGRGSGSIRHGLAVGMDVERVVQECAGNQLP